MMIKLILRYNTSVRIVTLAIVSIIIIMILYGLWVVDQPPIHTSSYRTTNENALDRVAFQYLQGKTKYTLSGNEATVLLEQDQTLAYIEITGPSSLHQRVNGEPLFVKDVCTYFAGYSDEEILRWFYNNLTFETPQVNINLNSNSLGGCVYYSAFFNLIQSCKPNKQPFRLALSGLHSISAVKDKTTSKLNIFDPSASLQLGTVNTLNEMNSVFLKKQVGNFFTTDGFNIPSGLAFHYYMMGFNMLEELRIGYTKGRLMQDHTRELFETMLGGVSSGKPVLMNFTGPSTLTT